MFIINSYSLAIFFCVITMLCWGSWANTMKLSPKHWPFQLFYWDYSIGLVLTSLILALTMGSTGEQGRSFLADLVQASAISIGWAMLGGIIFNLSNLMIVAATDIAGMAVAFPIAVGLALVIGVIVNYMAEKLGESLPVVFRTYPGCYGHRGGCRGIRKIAFRSAINWQGHTSFYFLGYPHGVLLPLCCQIDG